MDTGLFFFTYYMQTPNRCNIHTSELSKKHHLKKKKSVLSRRGAIAVALESDICFLLFFLSSERKKKTFIKKEFHVSDAAKICNGPTNIASVNLVPGCFKVFFFSLFQHLPWRTNAM